MSTTNHGWCASSVNSFAKRFADKYKPTWHVFVEIVREALLTEWVMTLVAGNDREVTVNEAFALRSDISTRLVTHHNMRFS